VVVVVDLVLKVVGKVAVAVETMKKPPEEDLPVEDLPTPDYDENNRMEDLKNLELKRRT
jgi:hypothetical protein